MSHQVLPGSPVVSSIVLNWVAWGRAAKPWSFGRMAASRPAHGPSTARMWASIGMTSGAELVEKGPFRYSPMKSYETNIYVVHGFAKIGLLMNGKQDEAHEPECRHVCWQTETILTCHISNKLTCETPWLHTLRWHSCRTPLLDTIAKRSGETLLLDTLVRHSCKTLLTWHSCQTLLLDSLVRHSSLTLLSDTLVRHSYLTLLWDRLTSRSYLTLL